MALDEVTLQRIGDWVTQQGVYNCVVEHNGNYFRINRSAGIALASADDIVYCPRAAAPQWLIDVIAALRLSR